MRVRRAHGCFSASYVPPHQPLTTIAISLPIAAPQSMSPLKVSRRLHFYCSWTWLSAAPRHACKSIICFFSSVLKGEGYDKEVDIWSIGT
jgi:hypothetical protein